MTKTKIIFTVLFILMFCPFLNAQNTLDSLNASLTNNQDFIDYLKIRDETMLTSCSIADTFSVNMTLNNLLSIDTLKITNGLSDYYYDLGMNYYKKGTLSKLDEWFYLAIANFDKCISIDSKRGDCYFNKSLIYYFLKDIGKAESNLALYKKYTPKTYWDKEFIDLIEVNLQSVEKLYCNEWLPEFNDSISISLANRKLNQETKYCELTKLKGNNYGLTCWTGNEGIENPTQWEEKLKVKFKDDSALIKFGKKKIKYQVLRESEKEYVFVKVD